MKKKYLNHILIISIIFLVDRLSKIYVINLAEDLSSLNITITSFLNIILVWNSGIGLDYFS